MRHIIGVVFAVAAFLLVMMCVPEKGAIYTHDSQSYEYAASTLVESAQFIYFGYDTPLIQWPPFYILLHALIRLFGGSFAQGAVWINAVAFAYLMYALAIYLVDRLSVKWLAVPALVMMMISVPLIQISGYAWTEMLFIFLSVLAMIFLLQFIKNKKQQGWLIASAVFSCLGWLTRYIGIVTIGVLVLMLFISVKPFIRKLKATFIYLVFSCGPMSLWVLRNYLISGTFTGGRLPGIYTLSDNIQLSLKVFESWSSYLTPIFSYIAVVFFVCLAVMTLFLEKKNTKKSSDTSIDLITTAVFIVAYAVVLIASATNTAMDPINSRLWSPVYPFWVLMLVLVMDFLIKNVKEARLKNWIAAGFAVFVLICSINPVLWIQNQGFSRKHSFLGQKEDIGVKYSPVLKLARDTIEPSADTLVICNDAGLLTMHSQLKCYYPPKKDSIPMYSFSRYKERTDHFQQVYLVWSGPLESESFMTVADFEQQYEMERIAQNNYCVIYRVR